MYLIVSFPQPGEEPCPLDPWIAVPDKSKYVDLQTLKLQENPEVSIMLPAELLSCSNPLLCDVHWLTTVT